MCVCGSIFERFQETVRRATELFHKRLGMYSWSPESTRAREEALDDVGDGTLSPEALLHHPLLSLLCNGYLEAFNTLRSVVWDWCLRMSTT